MGRPLKYETPEELRDAITGYFETCKENKVPTSMCGLALALGFNSRQSLLNYENRIEFMDIIKKARLTVEMHYELRLNTTSCTGAIFALKNMGWTDRQEIEHSGKMKHVYDTTDEELEEIIKSDAPGSGK